MTTDPEYPADSASARTGGDHRPVLLKPWLAEAKPEPGKRWIDGTFGRGGHTAPLLEGGALVLALDQDAASRSNAEALGDQYPGQLTWMRDNFTNMTLACREVGWSSVHGILLDLGVSSPQLDTAGRGFSFRLEGPLDMRMDQRAPLTAEQIVNEADEEELARIFYEYGDEKHGRQVARAIVRHRPLHTTTELAEVVDRAIPRQRGKGRGGSGVHPATRVFQALRIAVNRELDVLREVLSQAAALLEPGGLLCVISFHSGEDKLVKEYLRKYSSPWLDTPRFPNTLPNPEHYYSSMARHLPDTEEETTNPRSRSARLRIGVRNSTPVHVEEVQKRWGKSNPKPKQKPTS
ncbi:MAG: 16S rRNA (cytosine(1402)-N(4))-methyltransferase RsmH [Candidatus Methylacidiphilales bacterium]|nr:16S rRNA (cytosine(1402)-N(4))-methyltransferase RsmH [Candidatus Methylacidiphilales bacterium]